MMEEVLKEKVGTKVNAPNFEQAWTWLVEDNYVDEAIGDLEIGLRDEQEVVSSLVERCERMAARQRELLRASGSYTGSRPGRSKGSPVDVEPTPYERACADTYGRYLELMGEKRSHVIRFREKVLGGTLLSPGQALGLVNSPAAAYLPLEWFQSRRVPLIGHTARVIDEEWQREGEQMNRRTIFRIDPPGRTATINMRIRGDRPREPETYILRYLTDEESAISLRVRRASILHNLYKASSALARVLGANEADAAHFILTGRWPSIEPLSGQIRRDGISLIAAPWVSEKTVGHSFKLLQRQVRGGDNRPVSAKARAALLFVIEQADEQGRIPSWEELKMRWNRRYPKWSYKKREDLHRAYHRVAKVLLPAVPLDED